MDWRNLIEGHPRNISTKLFENQPYTFGGEDFFSFHYSHIRQKRTAPGGHVFVTINKAWRNLIEGHPRIISTHLFENQSTSFGEEEFLSLFCLVAIETRIMNGSQQFERIVVKTLTGCFLWSFIPITEKKMTCDGRRTKGDHNNFVLGWANKLIHWLFVV